MRSDEHEVAEEPQKQDGRKEDVERQLHKLRRRLDGIDDKIVALLSERQTEVEQIIAFKKAHSLPVYHPAREENLISRLRQQGRKVGLDPDFVEELYRRVLRQSRVEQTAHMARRGVRAGATVVSVGGNGAMGRYFCRWFADAGYRIRVLGRQDWSEADARCKDADLALVSVPIEVTTEVIARLGPYLPIECVLADVTSIKGPPLEAMLQAHNGPVVGLHPLFGPTTSTLDKQIVVATPGRNASSCQWLLDQFAAWGSIVIQADAGEHDDIMGVVQALRHFATFAFGQFLRLKDIDLHRTLDFSSPIYRLELVMVGRLFAQDPSLYAEIIFASPERRALIKDYVRCLNDNLTMLGRGDKALFCEEFKKSAKWFASFSEQAIRESSYLIDKLIERF
ncbi:MAG: bifunctional chorismate mutase/prephenate dehydrogenase [Deltaproteobacteria bacterium]|nr:bifunctional chorismate mutase/prephenate dehydrogenase [Deltaproteobacteria bacterium]